MTLGHVCNAFDLCLLVKPLSKKDNAARVVFCARKALTITKETTLIVFVGFVCLVRVLDDLLVGLLEPSLPTLLFDPLHHSGMIAGTLLPPLQSIPHRVQHHPPVKGRTA